MQFLRKLLGREPGSTPDSTPTPSPPARYKFKLGWATDVGAVRSHNEDTVLVITAAHDGDDARPAFGLFILADGMGGHRAGEVASSLAARVAAHHVMRRSYLAAIISQERDANQPALTEMLVDAVQAANSAVADQVPGGGTTLTCALVLGLQIYIAHVGDSRAYLITTEGLKQVTHDHSLVDRLIETGQLTSDEATTHPHKNVLYRAVGQSNALEVDIHVRTIAYGDRLLLCSDGLWDMVSEAKMLDVVRNASSPQAACDDLIVAANQAGGRDNITALLFESPLG
jgi:PPM family protein phosphatase